jgi:predicted amidohydrolase
VRVPVDTPPPTVRFGGLCWGALTCYDLRFPEVARRAIDAGAEVVFVPAAWLGGPGKQRQWEVLLAARAIENVAYVVGVGMEADGLEGGVRAFDPWGNPVGGQSETDPDIVLIEVDAGVVSRARVCNPSLDLRRFTVSAKPPGGLCGIRVPPDASRAS